MNSKKQEINDFEKEKNSREDARRIKQQRLDIIRRQKQQEIEELERKQKKKKESPLKMKPS